MKYFTILFTLLFVWTFQSCSKDSNNTLDSELVGTWKLTFYSVDFNGDDVADSNLLNEINCENEETLVFETNGTMTSYKTYNPKLEIGLRNGSNDNYILNVECPEGTIGFSATYTEQNGSVTIQDRMAILKNNQLTRIFENAIKIYNEDFTQVIATESLIIVYTKQ